MADIAINDVPRKAQYSGNTGLGPFQFTFNILNQTDIAVYKNSTPLNLAADYTVTLNLDGTGSITLTGTGNGTAVILADVITIVGDMALARVTDFTPGGDFQTAAVNEQLDSMVVMRHQRPQLRAPLTQRWPSMIALTIGISGPRQVTRRSIMTAMRCWPGRYTSTALTAR